MSTQFLGSNSIRTYIRRPKEQQKNEELTQPSLKNNVEGVSTVTTSTIHGQPFEDNMEFVGNDMPSLSLEHDVAVTTLVGMHGNENVVQWEEFVNNDMDYSLTSDEYLIHAKKKFDGIFFPLFDKMVHFKEKSTLWEDSFTASDELCRTKDVQNLDLVHRVTSLEKKNYGN